MSVVDRFRCRHAKKVFVKKENKSKMSSSTVSGTQSPQASSSHQISPTVAALLAASDAAIAESRNWKEDLNKSFAVDASDDEESELQYTLFFDDAEEEKEEEGKGTTAASAKGIRTGLYSTFAKLVIPSLALVPEVARALERGKRLQQQQQRVVGPQWKVLTTEAEVDENRSHNAQC